MSILVGIAMVAIISLAIVVLMLSAMALVFWVDYRRHPDRAPCLNPFAEAKLFGWREVLFGNDPRKHRFESAVRCSDCGQGRAEEARASREPRP